MVRVTVIIVLTKSAISYTHSSIEIFPSVPFIKIPFILSNPLKDLKEILGYNENGIICNRSIDLSK